MIALGSPNGSLLFFRREVVVMVVGEGLLIHVVCKMWTTLAILAFKNC